MAWFSVAQLALLGIISWNIQYSFGQTITQVIPTKVTYDTAVAHTAISTTSVYRNTADPTHGYYTEIYIDGNTHIVVGEKNRVGVYAVANLNLEAMTALPLVDDVCFLDAELCALRANYITAIDVYNNDWYYCGTNGAIPQCWKCENRECTAAEISDTGSGRFKALYAFASGGRQNIISGNVMVDHQPLLFDERVSNDVRVFGGDTLRIESGKMDSNGKFPDRSGKAETVTKYPHWTWKPRYVSDPIAFTNSEGQHVVYYFYYECAKETEDALPDARVYPRVARICRGDNSAPFFGGTEKLFSTFMKARLNCSIPEFLGLSTSFDFLSDVFQSTVNPKLLYMVFRDYPLNNKANSAVCVYHLDLIDYIFRNSLFKGQGITYYGRTGKPLWLELKPGVGSQEENYATTRRTCPTVTVEVTDHNFQNFIFDYLLLNSTIPSFQGYPASVTLPASVKLLSSQPPIMLLTGLNVTEMVVQEKVCGDPGQTVFFLGTDDGKVYKAYVYGLGTSSPETRIVEEIDLTTGGAQGDDHEIISMEILLNPDNDDNTFDSVIFVGTYKSLHKIPVQHCSDYNTFEKCILAQDPYCTWSGSACTANCDGTKCETSDPYTSCASLSWTAAPEVIKHPTEDDCCPTTYDRIANVNSGSVMTEHSKIMIDMFVESTDSARWEETTIACGGSCGCPPTEKEENTGIYTIAETNGDFKSYLLGTYVFDMSSCTDSVTVTFTFKTLGNMVSKAVTVTYDNGALVTDTTENAATNNLDAKLYAYKYQLSWWNKNKNTNRNAESASCSNCPIT